MNNTYNLATAFLLGFAAALMIRSGCSTDDLQERTTEHIDTSSKAVAKPAEQHDMIAAKATVRQPEKLRKNSGSSKLPVVAETPTHDSLFRDLPPFEIASEPQIMNTGDTVSVVYFYPENTFTIKFRPAPDTVKTITATRTTTVVEGSSFWEDAGKVLGGAALGALAAILF